MFQEVTELLDEIGYAFDRHELKMCMIRAQKKKFLKALIEDSRRKSFDLSSNVNKSILASIASTPDISEKKALAELEQYVSKDLDENWSHREKLLTSAMRHTEEFRMLLILNGDAAVRYM
ncbi:hypothetical protein [Vibrio bivalvicida]|uniref:Uncharacterized protein n=1 Tax=Vibrio bivalvicida TaxID=1276888 RepID=A0ABV4MDQ3_9VIBR